MYVTSWAVEPRGWYERCVTDTTIDHIPYSLFIVFSNCRHACRTDCQVATSTASSMFGLPALFFHTRSTQARYRQANWLISSGHVGVAAPLARVTPPRTNPHNHPRRVILSRSSANSILPRTPPLPRYQTTRTGIRNDHSL
jgi:hypothetical protein